MSRPRQYKAVDVLKDGVWGWGLVGQCVQSGCETRTGGGWRPPGPWGERDCGHWALLPGWWPTEADALAQAAVWTAHQQLLLDNGFDLRPGLVAA
jgi:hypothetical protein